MKHVHRVNCQPQRFYFALPWSKISAQHALDLERIFLDLVLILSFFPIAIEEGPGQPLFNVFTSDISNVCTLEPASNVLLRVCHLGLDAIEKLASLFLRAWRRMDGCVLEVPPIRNE
jgi:hypothetical protein